MNKLFSKMKEAVCRGAKLVKECVGKIPALATTAVGGATLATSQAQAAIPAGVQTAIDDMILVGAAAFAAVVLVSLPFIAWAMVKKIRG